MFIKQTCLFAIILSLACQVTTVSAKGKTPAAERRAREQRTSAAAAALEGTWEALSMSAGKTAVPLEKLKEFRMRFTSGKTQMLLNNQIYSEGSIAFGEPGETTRFTIEPKEGPALEGEYRLRDDRLELDLREGDETVHMTLRKTTDPATPPQPAPVEKIERPANPWDGYFSKQKPLLSVPRPLPKFGKRAAQVKSAFLSHPVPAVASAPAQILDMGGLRTGKWTVVADRFDGVDGQTGISLMLDTQKGEATWSNTEQNPLTQTRKFSVDASHDPYQITFEDAAGKMEWGIFRIEENKLVLCITSYLARPLDFSGEKGTGLRLITLEAADAD